MHKTLKGILDVSARSCLIGHSFICQLALSGGYGYGCQIFGFCPADLLREEATRVCKPFVKAVVKNK